MTKSFASLAFALSLTSALAAQGAKPPTQAPAKASTSAGTPALTAPLPVDPKVRIGTLPNGIRYYIRKNVRPEKRAELRLVVNAGSVLENEDQLGYAHFLEHT